LKVAAKLIDLFSAAETSPDVSRVLSKISVANIHLLRQKQNC
jgi:hypothetical protein